MIPGEFTAAEWKQLVNAPQLIHHLLTATDRGAFFTKRSEAKALEQYLSGYRSQSTLVQSILAAQKDADDKIKASSKEAQDMLEQVGALLEAKVGEAEGDAVRDFLMNAAATIAKAASEQAWAGGKPVSAGEEKLLAQIAAALKATEADNRRRHDAALAVEAKKRAEAAAEARRQAAEQAYKEREAEAKRQAEEQARREREAEIQRQVEQFRKEREAEARRQAEQIRKEHEAEAQRQAEQARKEREAEAQRQAEQALQKREAEAQKAKDDSALREAAALKQKAEAMKREAEALEHQAETIAGGIHGAGDATETIYVVKPGDTLSGIAKSVYGKAARWPEIFEANKDIIKKPNLIRPGWKLRIPR